MKAFLTALLTIFLLVPATTPAVADHTHNQGDFRDCLDHGGTRDECACQRQPLSC